MKNIPPTPWSALSDAGNDPCIIDANGYHVLEVRDTALRIHIAQCVNACAGMDDSVAEVEKLRTDLESALRDHNDTLRGIVNKLRDEAGTGDPVLDSLVGQVDISKLHSARYLAGLTPDGFKEALEVLTKQEGQGYKPATTEQLKQMVEDGKPCPIKFIADKFQIRNSLGDVVVDSDWVYPKFVTDSCNAASKNVLERAMVKTWHELGELPPVGTECEALFNYVWRKVEILAYRGEMNAAVCLLSEIVDGRNLYWSCDFRPLQTEKQKTIAELLPIVAALDGTQANAEKACEKIYDKFIAKKQ